MSDELNKPNQISDPKNFQVFGSTVNDNGEVLESGYLPIHKIITGDGVPIGTVVLWFDTRLPKKWIWLNGQELDTTEYAELHKVLGYNFGGSGSSFHVPDMKGFPLRKDDSNEKFNELGKSYDGINLLDGTSNQATACEFILYTGVDQDTGINHDTGGYIKGEYGQVWYRMNCVYNGFAGWVNDYNWDKTRAEWIADKTSFRTRNDSDPLIKNSNSETIQTVMIDKGEYEWFTKSIPMAYGDGNNRDVAWLQGYGYSDADVQMSSANGFIGRADLNAYDIQKMIGGWCYRGEQGVSSFYNNDQNIEWKIFRETKDGTNESREWYMADESDYHYMLGIMPNITDNFHEDAMNFFCMSAKEDTLNLSLPLTRKRNISGLNFAPLGRRQNWAGDGHLTGWPIYSYPSDAAFLCQNKKAFIISANGWSGKGSGVYMSSSDTSLHGAQVRYCRRIPDNKLGYKLIYNTTTDKVNFVTPDWGTAWYQENIIPPNPNMNQIPGPWNGQPNYNGFIYLEQSAIQGKHLAKFNNVRARFYPDTNTSGVITVWKSTDNHGQNVIWEKQYTVNGVSDGYFNLDVDIDLASNEFIGFGKSTDNTRLWMSATGFNPVAGGFFVRANNAEANWDLGIGISIGDPLNTKPTDQDVIPRNIERGVAMRYANLNKTNILASTISKKWSEIKAEAADRLSKINFVKG